MVWPEARRGQCWMCLATLFEYNRCYRYILRCDGEAVIYNGPCNKRPTVSVVIVSLPLSLSIVTFFPLSIIRPLLLVTSRAVSLMLGESIKWHLIYSFPAKPLPSKPPSFHVLPSSWLPLVMQKFQFCSKHRINNLIRYIYIMVCLIWDPVVDYYLIIYCNRFHCYGHQRNYNLGQKVVNNWVNVSFLQAVYCCWGFEEER